MTNEEGLLRKLSLNHTIIKAREAINTSRVNSTFDDITDHRHSELF